MSIIQDVYQVPWVPSKVGLGAVFARRESRVLWLAVRSTHRVSDVFARDVLNVAKTFRRLKPKNALGLERILWHCSEDPSLKCPWRPQTGAPLVIRAEPETEQQWSARFDADRQEFLSKIEELRAAMAGERRPPVTFEIVLPSAVKEN